MMGEEVEVFDEQVWFGLVWSRLERGGCVAFDARAQAGGLAVLSCLGLAELRLPLLAPAARVPGAQSRVSRGREVMTATVRRRASRSW